MKVTQEALESGAQAAQKMGFALTPFMIAPIVEAAFSQMFPDVEVDAEDYRLRKVEKTVEMMAATVSNIGAYIQANDPLIQSLRDGSFAESVELDKARDLTEALAGAWRSDAV